MKLYCHSETPLRNGDPSFMDDWQLDDRHRVMQDIYQWYGDGRPLYPRRILEDVRRKLRQPLSTNDLVDVEALDGNNYQYEVRTGASLVPSDIGDDINPAMVPILAWSRPIIDYTCWDELTLLGRDNTRTTEWKPFHSYCSIGIAHFAELNTELPEALSRIGIRSPTRRTVDNMLEDTSLAMLRLTTNREWWSIEVGLSKLHVPWKINKVFGIGCGTEMTSAPAEETFPPRSTAQHAFILFLARLLQETPLGSESTQCYFQDTTYTTVDEQNIRHFNGTALTDPEAYLLMDAQSIVFSSFPTSCVKSIIADNARPAMLIVDSLHEDNGIDPFEPRVQHMLERSYQWFNLPKLHDDEWWPMSLYIRNEFIPAQFQGFDHTNGLSGTNGMNGMNGMNGLNGEGHLS